MKKKRNINFHHISYALHEKSYVDKNVKDEILLYKNWFDNDTVDIWRHLRMLNFLDIFLESYPKSTWLTVGDGRFGTSAMYINRKGGNALPTDIDLSLLKVAKENNMIDDYAYANAESLPFSDDKFDFAFCKESYHHFPCAYIAIYEMLRVSKKAIMLVEPNDWLPSPIPRRILQLIKNFIKKFIGLRILHPDTGNYEPIGNYIFTISEREFQKIASGLNLPYVAFKKFNDVYIEGVEYEKVNSKSSLFKKINRKLFFMNVLYKIGLSGKNHIITIIFKDEPNPELQNKLSKIGFQVIKLPTNPYLPAN